MTVEEMHYDFKTKINKVDSQQYRNLKIPEIDWALNEAQELFVKLVAEPRMLSNQGFEINQRSIDDIKNIVKIEIPLIPNIKGIVALPQDYWHYVRGRVISSKRNCINKSCVLKIRQQDDTFEESPFDKSSFEWREINGIFFDGGIKLYFEEGVYGHLLLSYIRKPAYIHFASGFNVSGYKLPDGTLLTGTQDCELSFHTHREIVDIAVALTTGHIQAPDYQVKFSKLNLDNLI